MKKLLIATLSVSLLASCQPKTTAPSEQPPASMTEPTNTEKPVPSQPPEQKPTPTPELQIKKQYTMNKNYDIVPTEEGVNKKVVLLTFDDGPKEQKLIDQMIDVLDKHNAKAIFFVNGYRVKQNPNLLKLIHSRGQIIGNHSWDHIDLKKEPREKVEKQIQDVQNVVKELTGQTPQFFRPPFGSSNEAVKEIVKNEKMLFMTWSNGSEDWIAKYQNPEGLTQRVLDQLHPGSNILMHELQWTADALDGLLTKIEEKGYSFVDPRSIVTE